ncbi:hypothetical protein PsalMR5_02680 [Piscirickettsia salmonis]|uniref:hypothetical protein n=1 Tax=Piscirickettsia salmonis TaxID=1238 RepID=UPI0012BA660D|nr:hypothetical protein [Piscirickettsia salmonis]QGP55235.1 hypothetical protein PsalSR1_02679 [Piscirickettsia salmonis]QGP58913.1 hypothetical protein PsalBI1_01495 [Piscirickettsia salmonis]QGP64801.1 hypothetical protein PsalMR5_02680 [Piscirickettsia salmonis]
MKFIYPGINAPLDTAKSLYAETTQGYFNHKESGEALDLDFIKGQESYLNKWDKRTLFTREEYQALTYQQRLQLYKLHTTRWNYTLSLLLQNPDAGPGTPTYNEKQFLQNLNKNEEMRKLYAGWFIGYVENNQEKIDEAVEALFKKEMQLKPECDLSKEKQIAAKVRQFRANMTQLKSLPNNQPENKQSAIDQYETKAISNFIKHQLTEVGEADKIDLNTLEKTLKKAEEKCIKSLKKDSLSQVVLATSNLCHPTISLTENWDQFKSSTNHQKIFLLLHNSNINLTESWNQVKDNTHLQKAVLTLHGANISLAEHWEEVKGNEPLQKALAAAYDYLNTERSTWSKVQHSHGIRQTQQFICKLMAGENKNLDSIRAEMQHWIQGYGRCARPSSSQQDSRFSFTYQSGVFPQAPSSTPFLEASEGEREAIKHTMLNPYLTK